jgi:hypothetical protein
MQVSTHLDTMALPVLCMVKSKFLEFFQKGRPEFQKRLEDINARRRKWQAEGSGFLAYLPHDKR